LCGGNTGENQPLALFGQAVEIDEGPDDGNQQWQRNEPKSY
jgi:hypothetical protein